MNLKKQKLLINVKRGSKQNIYSYILDLRRIEGFYLKRDNPEIYNGDVEKKIQLLNLCNGMLKNMWII